MQSGFQLDLDADFLYALNDLPLCDGIYSYSFDAK